MTATNEASQVLAVFMDNQHVGRLHNETPLAFSYEASWLASPAAHPLNPTLPLQAGKLTSPNVVAFFENLLPEGDQRTLLSMHHHVSTLFGLLATVGGDVAGSVVLLPWGQIPQPAHYQRLTWDQVNQLLHDGALKNKRLDKQIRQEEPRRTLSGVQYKLLLSLDADGLPLLPFGSSPSTHILKPDIVRNDVNLFSTAVNETIVMRTARLCELPAANVAYQPETNACLITRYDRIAQADGTLKRLWQADFCQLLGKPSDVKYESDGGPTFKACFDLLRTYSVQPAIDQRQLLRWLFFNLYVGNNDSHAKNLSLLSSDQGLSLAPFYDLMCTRVYTGLASQFTFQIGGEYSPGKIQRSHLESLATSIGVKTNYLLTIARDMAEQVEKGIHVAASEVAVKLKPAEHIMAERIQQKVISIVKKMGARWSQS
jgi:serine/threonine-protein kinase HipA